MPYSTQNFQPLSLAQVSPLGYAVQQGVQGIGQGVDLYKNILAAQLENYKKQYEQQRSANYPQLLQAELAKAQAEPKEIEARTNLYGTEANRYNKLLPYEIQEKQALAGQHGAEAQKAALITSYLKKYGTGQDQGQPENEGQVQPVQQEEPAQKYVGNYGIEVPKPNQEDIINKVAFGVDTFSPKQQQANELMKKQQNAYVEKISKAAQQAQSALQFSNELDQYNYYENQMTFQGKKRNWIPFTSWSTASQGAKSVINKMSLGAIENMRDAMGSARFAVADLNVAMGQKPAEDWNPETRAFYTDFNKAGGKRMQEMSQFYNVAGNLKIPIQYADALWTQYQQKYPLTRLDKLGKPQLIERSGKEWQQFLTPEAVNSIATKGDYSPIAQEHITQKNIEDTMKLKYMTKDQVLNELENRGYDISHIR